MHSGPQVMQFGVPVQAAKEILRADDDTVSFLLGGLTLGTGIVGTLGGGAHCILLMMAHYAHNGVSMSCMLLYVGHQLTLSEQLGSVLQTCFFPLLAEQR